ncbi:transmembrane protein 179B-like isoform X2 [Polyodon spathula]|uniref:transmembrane protein 179B-like isoform X2 n=1 Tax=Polyodon spathula TaxID=7913 RepID=UPI001B7DB91E|nr:transmembrane protein 179B-like isoform X2 [Polyodon spathula]
MAQWLLVAELTCVRCVFFICGIITVSSLTITQGEFAGRCMLYGTVHYNASSSEFCVESSSNASLCYFVSAISILIAIYCFSVVLYWVYARCVDEVQRGSVWMTLSLCIAVTFLFFLLVSGCILNIGLNGLCQSITAAKDLKSCQAAQLEKWSAPNKSSLFYTSLHNAQVSAWVNFFFWVVALILLIVQRKRGTWFTQLSGTGDPETDPIFHRPHSIKASSVRLSQLLAEFPDLPLPRLEGDLRVQQPGHGSLHLGHVELRLHVLVPELPVVSAQLRDRQPGLLVLLPAAVLERLRLGQQRLHAAHHRLDLVSRHRHTLGGN